MSILTATIGVWFVTILWGSWFQTVKHIKNYPVHAFITLMYAISVCLVWGCIGCFGQELIRNGVFHEIKSNMYLSFVIMVCGGIFGIAMQMHLYIVKRIGLILSTSVSATCAILGGTFVSLWFAGVPEGVSIPLILFASCLLICATICCQYAGYRHDQDAENEKSTESSRGKDVVLLAFINFVLMSSYPLANSLGLRTVLNPNGFSPLTCMGLLVIGAFLGACIFSFIQIHKKGWDSIKHCNLSYAKLFCLTAIAAFAHFGGNVLHSIFAPIISVSIATAMGNSYHVWSYIWGLCYGEFKGASLKTYVLLGFGILLFIIGVLLLSLNTA